MRKFNLTFKGGILPGYKPEQARARLADFFGIDDLSRVEPFFSGKPVVLRRDLDRKEGGNLYRKLRELGLETELVTVSEDPEDVSPTPRASAGASQDTEASQVEETVIEPDTKAPSTRGMVREIRRQQPGQIDQSWAVPSRPVKKPNEPPPPKRASLKDLKTAAQARLDSTTPPRDEEQERKAAEEAARQKAEEAERKRIAAEEAAKRKAEEAERKRIAAEEAAKRKAEEAERKRIATKEAAKRKAEEAERKRIAAAEADKRRAEEAERKAEEAERKRIAAEEAAKRKAEEAERKRIAAEEAAKRKAEEAERKRIAAEEAARQKAEQKRKREAEAARRREEKAAAEEKLKAEKEAARLAAKAAAEKRRAEEAEARKRAREEAAKAKALRDAEKQAQKERAAEEKAQRQAARERAAAEAAEKKALEKEKRLLAAADAARRKAEEEHQRAEEAAKLQAEREAERAEQAKLRQEAERQAKQEREDARRAQKSAEDRKRAEAQAAKREARAQAEQERAARQHALARKRAEEEAAARAAEESRRELEEKTVNTAARKLVTDVGVTKSTPRVRSKLELPRRTLQTGASRQLGAPNLFALEPFRATMDVRQRSEHAQKRWRLGLALLIVGVLALLVLGNYFRLLPQEAIPSGPEAIATDPAGNLYLWSGDTLYLHDRAGVGMRQLTADDLGIPPQVTQLGWLPGAGLLINTRQPDTDPNEPLRAHVCEVEFNRCQPYAYGVMAKATSDHPRTGTRIQFNAASAELSRYAADGDLVASLKIDAPASPVLHLQGGLLFMNSVQGPAISVFRPDTAGFGRQLDEILLIPPSAIEAGLDRVADFIPVDEDWWVLLTNQESGATGVYRFDSQWNLLGEIDVRDDVLPDSLLNWSNRVLLQDSAVPVLLRYNASGMAEVPLEPDALLADIQSARSSRALMDSVKRAGLSTLALLCLGVAIFAYLQLLRSRVYKGGSPRGAEPIDAVANEIEWITPYPSREQHFRRLGAALGTLTLGLLLTAVGLQATAGQLGAVLLVSGALLLVLYLIYRTPAGHLGMVSNGLVIVDHHGVYHLGAGPRIRYRGAYTLIDDVLLYTGSRLLPVFDKESMESARDVMKTGIRVERQVIWVHLLQSRHPLALGSLLLLAACGLALVLAVS